MPGFCGSCGAPMREQAGFCSGCGARSNPAGPQPAPPPQAQPPFAAPPPVAAGGSVVKIVLIAVGVLFVLGAIGVGAMYYTARRYVRMAEEATGVKADDVIGSVREAAKRSGKSASSVKRDGCLLL